MDDSVWPTDDFPKLMFVKLRPEKAPHLRRNLQLVNFLLWSPGRSPIILPHWHTLPISQIKVVAHWLMTCGFDIRLWSKGRPSCGPPIPMSKRMWPWWGLTSWRAGKRQLATWWTISLPLDKGSPGLQSSADIWLSRRIWLKGLGFRILFKNYYSPFTSIPCQLLPVQFFAFAIGKSHAHKVHASWRNCNAEKSAGAPSVYPATSGTLWNPSLRYGRWMEIVWSFLANECLHLFHHQFKRTLARLPRKMRRIGGNEWRRVRLDPTSSP